MWNFLVEILTYGCLAGTMKLPEVNVWPCWDYEENNDDGLAGTTKLPEVNVWDGPAKFRPGPPGPTRTRTELNEEFITISD